MNIIILISGNGTNMKFILDNNIPVKAVVSNVLDAPGLKIANNYGIKTIACKSLQDVCNAIEKLSPDLICLAGFMKILPPYITKKFQIMNIHPSLLPHFPGLHAQKQAIQAKAKYSGCTVHMVDEKIDNGKIIVQKVVPIIKSDTVNKLSKRILEQEHVAYTEAIRIFNGMDVPRPSIGKSFKNINNAILNALDNDISYLWWYDSYNIVVSNKPPKNIPHVVCTRGDTINIIQSRLNNILKV